MRVTLGELRRLIREALANDTPYNANKAAHPDPGGATWDKGMDQDSAPVVGMDESEEEHTDTRGAHRHADPRWDDHADPTAKAWDTGLE
jgi:hypothetical protein